MAKEKKIKTRTNKNANLILKEYEESNDDIRSNKSFQEAKFDFTFYLNKNKKNEQTKKIETIEELQQWLTNISNGYTRESISDIKYLAVVLPGGLDKIQPINVIKEIVRGKYDCRFPVVFKIKNDFKEFFCRSGGDDEFLRTYGLGQFLYSEEKGCFLLPESESKSQTKTEGPTPSSESSGRPTGEGNTNASVGQQTFDHDRIIEEFMKTQRLLNDLQMEHLKMYVRPVNIIQLLRHDGGNAKTQTELGSYQTQLNDLLDKENIRSEVENKIQHLTHRNIEDKIDNTSESESITNNESYQETNEQKEDENLRRQIEEFKHMCDIAEERILEKQNDRLNGTSVKTPIYALLLDDRCNDNDIKAFIYKAKKKGIHIIPTTNVAEAEEELLTLEHLKHHLAETENKNDDKDPRYTVILVDLLLKEKHKDPSITGTESLIVSRRQGYDFVRDLARMGRQYGVILLSTLPRNFKTMVAGSLPLRTRNFPYKDGGKLAIPEYQQLLIDMIVEAHDENNEEAIFRAFTKRGFAMHYIRYMIQNKGFDDVNRETEKAIKSFLDYVNLNSPDNLKNEWEKNDKNKGKPKNGDESKWLSKLTTKYAPIMNEEDINASVEEFLNNIYSWSWESYCEQGCPSAPLSDEQKSKINKYCREQISKNDNSSNPIIKILKNNDNIISAFIEDCYNSTLSFKTTFELYKQKEEVRDFVKRLFIYKDAKNKYPDNDSLKTRFIARRLALFLFFWANLSEYASKNYVGKEVPVKTSKKKGKKETQEPSKHTLTAFDYVNQILNRIGKAKPTEFDNPTSLVNNGVWLKAIYFQKKRNPECLYMTAEEQAFFYELFNKTEDYQFPLKQMVEDEQLDKILKINDRKMCSELIYYFK